MNSKEFFYKVAEMRERQKDYFIAAKHQSMNKIDALNESKKLEKEVDKEIERVKNILKQKEFEKKNPQIF